ncbi:MAG: hypothetical protein R3264_04340 [Anaerolineae bacterium]|nr:hypothetical protein [Anaerolineae bacterium]
MKYLILLFVILLWFLTACGQPAVEPPPATAEPEQELAEPQPNSPIATPAEGNGSPLATPAPPQTTPAGTDGEVGALEEVSWNTDPEAVIISATFCCGFTTRTTVMNYLAAATIFGDGRIVWVETDLNGGRQVFEAKLDPDQLSGLISRIEADGFFDWEDRYANENVADAAEQCLSVNLNPQQKQVCEYVEGAPPAFHQLYDDLDGGLGLSGTAFVPERAYVTATPLEGFSAGDGPPITGEWPADELGVSLADYQTGTWLEGEPLATAWQIINQNWQIGLVQEGDTVYELWLQLPALSLAAPME